jgi:AraC family transcriptional regulator
LWEDTVTLQAVRDSDQIELSDRPTPQILANLSILLSEATRFLEKDHAALGYLARARALIAHDTAAVSDTSKQNGRQVLAPWQAARVKKFIEDNIDTSVKTEELVALTRLSASYFFRAFKGSFGMPPHAYIVMRRIDRAQALLTSTDESLCQIALAVGLNDQAHLSRLFRQQTGRTPGAWRREYRGIALEAVKIQIAS